MDSFYWNRSTFERLRNTFLSFHNYARPIRARASSTIDQPAMKKIRDAAKPTEHLETHLKYTISKGFGKQEMIRDLFIWSVYAGYVDIAFVLLLQLESRISAALVAAAIAERLSFDGTNVGIRNVYNEHRIAYEEYATACVKACYTQNERLACQLLLREIPLFGNITCMQVIHIRFFMFSFIFIPF